jgi:hypothetical protein
MAIAYLPAVDKGARATAIVPMTPELWQWSLTQRLSAVSKSG